MTLIRFILLASELLIFMDDDKFNSYRKKVGNGQIIGSRGEMFVGFLLSSFCLIRPVANGTDVGVDLYCETLIDGIPHSHFWVQVKTQTTNRLRASLVIPRYDASTMRTLMLVEHGCHHLSLMLLMLGTSPIIYFSKVSIFSIGWWAKQISMIVMVMDRFL
jgi:hypothetical protein